jgi:hypothetical protein
MVASRLLSCGVALSQYFFASCPAVSPEARALTSDILAWLETDTWEIVGLRSFLLTGLILLADDNIQSLHLALPVAHGKEFQRLTARWLTFGGPERVAMGALLQAGSVPPLVPVRLGSVSSLSRNRTGSVTATELVPKQPDNVSFALGGDSTSGQAGNDSVKGVGAEADQERATDVSLTNVADILTSPIHTQDGEATN